MVPYYITDPHPAVLSDTDSPPSLIGLSRGRLRKNLMKVPSVGIVLKTFLGGLLSLLLSRRYPCSWLKDAVTALLCLFWDTKFIYFLRINKFSGITYFKYSMDAVCTSLHLRFFPFGIDHCLCSNEFTVVMQLMYTKYTDAD